MADMMMVFSPSEILVGEVFLIDLVEVVADKMDDACISCQSHHENLSTMEFIIGTFPDFPDVQMLFIEGYFG